MVSVLILTKDEEQDLPGCLSSVSWSDDVHVLDSFSTDGTVTIAKRSGAKVTQRRFDNWSTHQNFALRHIDFKHPWVLYIDADERVTPRLAQAIAEAVTRPGENVAFRVQRRDFLLETWLKHVQITPTYIRLFRPEKMRYERLVNPVSLADGPVGDLTGHLEHFPFSKGIGHWLNRHNSYSSFEARQFFSDRDVNKRVSVWKAIAANDRTLRRYYQKQLFSRMPARPILKFLFLYVLKGGLLDGKAGFTYAVLQAFYEYMITLKVREIGRDEARASEGGALLCNASERSGMGLVKATVSTDRRIAVSPRDGRGDE